VQPILDSAGRRAEEGRPGGAPTSEDAFPVQVMAVEQQQQQQQVGPYAGVDIHLRGLAGAAEGFGSAAIGGLHGEVYHVTSLAGIVFLYTPPPPPPAAALKSGGM
jgi:pectate lyase